MVGSSSEEGAELYPAEANLAEISEGVRIAPLEFDDDRDRALGIDGTGTATRSSAGQDDTLSGKLRFVFSVIQVVVIVCVKLAMFRFEKHARYKSSIMGDVDANDEKRRFRVNMDEVDERRVRLSKENFRVSGEGVSSSSLWVEIGCMSIISTYIAIRSN